MSFQKIDFNRISFSYCHRRSDRSFFFKGKKFPVCARCTGIHLGYLAYPLFLFDLVELNLFTTVLLIAPTYLDGIVQMFFDIESNNYRRVITGLLSGVGMMSLLCIIGTAIGNQIIYILNN